MLGVQLERLLAGTPPGVAEALDLAAGLDDALVGGLARLDERSTTALTTFAAALHATPLGPALGEAVEKIKAGSVGDEHLAALAGGRTALFGAAHDALLAHLDAALDRTRTPWAPPGPSAEPRPPATETEPPRPAEPPEPPQPPGNLLPACREWLHELAITGWRGVDHDLVSASDQAIAAVLAEPRLRRTAVLLDGLAAELRASCPVAAMERLPARRWADLWARAMSLSQPGGDAAGAPGGDAAGAPGGDGAGAPGEDAAGIAPAGPVSGRLLPLGVDVHEHATAVQAQVHAILEPADGSPPLLVRTGVAATKVDTIVGPALWRLLQGHPVLLTALAEHRGLEITDMPVRPGGDLLWHDDRATAGEQAGPFEIARVHLAGASAASVPPLERHPVRLAEPVLLEGYTVDGDTLTLDGHALDIDLARLPSCGPLTPELVSASSACVGLLRWDDGRWLLQPLAVQATIKRKPVEAHTGDWALGPTDAKIAKADAKTGDAVAVLRERAGRLLRK